VIIEVVKMKKMVEVNRAPAADGGISSDGGETGVSIEIEAGGSAPAIIDSAPPPDGGITSVGGENNLDASASNKPCTGHFTVVSYLKEHGYSLRTLVAMSYELKSDSGTPMLDVAAEPFASMPAKTIKALASDYRSEVGRRYSYSHVKDDPHPRPMLWSIPRCQEWLDRHPINDSGELSDIAAEIDKYRIIAEKAVTERKANDQALIGEKKRQGKFNMRALVDQVEIKRAYLTQQRAYLTRQRAYVTRKRRVAVEKAKKNKAMLDELTKQMSEIDKEILVAEMKAFSRAYLTQQRAYLTRQRAYVTRKRRVAVEKAKKNKAMLDELTKQMSEIDKEILVAEMKAFSG
jgi:hypothetical protein